MIKAVEGNILAAKEDIIGHQVNGRFVMGSGLAWQIRNKYPKAYEEYLDLKPYAARMSMLGRVQLVEINKERYVANIFGQQGYGRDKQYTDYEALENGLSKLKVVAMENELSIALPHGIGCGLAGGDWEVVYETIERVFNDYEVTLYKY